MQEIRINKALSRGKDSKLSVKTTKTGIARTIKMDEQTMEILKDWKRNQKEISTIKSDTNQLVFNNEQNDCVQPTKTRKWILRIQNKYDLPKITTYGLRHTYIALLFLAGASIKEVQDRVGSHGCKNDHGYLHTSYARNPRKCGTKI